MSRRLVPSRSLPLPLVLGLVLLAAAPAWATAGAHGDPVAPVVLALAVILAAARLGGDLAERVGQPAVLGELLAGILLGSLDLFGVPWLHAIERDPTIEILAGLGVIVLLFEVGLESTIREMAKVGLPSLLVALLGVAVPFALGWGLGALWLPDHSVYSHVFLGATLTATSVGITARVLKDLGRSQSAEARIILGAAVIDDVLGLVILGAITGIIVAANAGTVLTYGETGLLFAKAVGFLFGALALGTWLSPRLFAAASRLRGSGVLLTTALVFCFLLAWSAAEIGLAAIVGAYAAGLILEPVHFRGFEKKGEQQLEHLVRPIATFLVPVFFVLMGMRVDLRAFASLDVIGFATALTIAAILGKQVCSLGAFGRKGINRLAVGIGMIPRGEVGLIFANIGLGLSVGGVRVVDESTFSAVVIMVVVTTMATPPALKWSLQPRRGAPGGRAGAAAD